MKPLNLIFYLVLYFTNHKKHLQASMLKAEGDRKKKEGKE